ncbi:MAG: dap4 1 [Verrucomicrobiaceae bacterium]|nr:dap4 1 [Verrucomicrobiaceae bacterium]
MKPLALLLLVSASLSRAASPALLEGTQPLAPNADFSATMVAGIDKYLLRQIEESKTTRHPHRERLRTILGAIDPRLPIKALELVGDTSDPALLAENANGRIYRVRWPVLEGVQGEGILIQPKTKPLARVVYLPDADTLPEMIAGIQKGHPDFSLINSGCEIVIPTLISRDSSFSSNEHFNIKTNIPHREWIYRQAFELGRHVIGYEVQKVLSLVDLFSSEPGEAPILVAGLGEGGLLAMYAGALDTRIGSTYVWGFFGPREGVWEEPIYRNVFGLLKDFGDAEIASLIAPRKLAVHHLGFPNVKDPAPSKAPGVRNIAAPGKITKPTIAESKAEIERARKLAGSADWVQFFDTNNGAQDVVSFLFPNQSKTILKGMESAAEAKFPDRDFTADNQPRQKRQVRELETYTQRLLPVTEDERTATFWKPLPLGSLEAYEQHIKAERERFYNDTIGRLPDPNVPVNPRSRLVSETDKVTIYEVTLDVWDGVFAWGWLCLPKDLKPGEKRPVVVCQHGLEGIPEDAVTTDEKNKAWNYYHGFAQRLAEQGFVTFAPHNSYRGHDAFRTLQRKLNPLGKTLYSVIIPQHQRITGWLKTQPFVDPARIGFYGLSYGGKSAMRIPAIDTDYCLSICSGDFNEWVRKCVCLDMPMNYVFTPEYEIWEWNMGRTFNYAEMAALIAPRPFMVERGHNDGVGLDEWVSYEYAKVRRLYNKLGIGDRTTIEYFDGPHTIHGLGTYEFLHQKLGWK